MDVIIVCHTEFGYVHNDRSVVYEKSAVDGVEKGVPNLINIADRYGAKVTFAVMPEVVKYFPGDIDHEIGLHIHPGWRETINTKIKFFIGDKFLKENCQQSINSTVLRDYPYKEQLDMLKTGKDFIYDSLNVEPKAFVAGRWSINNDTIKALINCGITHELSALPGTIEPHYDWSKLSRMCMPYHPHVEDYQKKGDLPILVCPISNMLLGGNVNPEKTCSYGLKWLKACFLEYYCQNAPLFHICLHSPCMTDPYFISSMNDLLDFISKRDVIFKFASEIIEYKPVDLKPKLLPYLPAINKDLISTFIRAATGRME